MKISDFEDFEGRGRPPVVALEGWEISEERWVVKAREEEEGVLSCWVCFWRGFPYNEVLEVMVLVVCLVIDVRSQLRSVA